MSSIDEFRDFVSSIAMGVLWSAISPNAGFAAAAVVALAAAVTLFVIRLPAVAPSVLDASERARPMSKSQ